MARHRNVRSMNYAEEYDGYDDVYGHSVEDDYSISPSDAAYVFDRNTNKAQMSAFLAGDEDIAEEDEDAEEGVECVKRRDSDTLGLRSRNLSELDEARLRSCLDEIRNVIGDSMSEATLADIILANDFDVAKSLDASLSNAADDSIKPPLKIKKQETLLPQREPRALPSIGKIPQVGESAILLTPALSDVTASPTLPPPIKVVPPGVKTVNVTKGFEVLSVKQDHDSGEGLRPSVSTPGTQSPSSGRATPSGRNTPNIGESGEGDGAVREARTRPRISKQDIMDKYNSERGATKEQLHMVVIGHVDAGKSTLMGRLLLELGQVSKKTMHKYEQESKKLGKQSFVYAWILDETGEERSRGITMDVGQSKFETKSKQVTLLDAPGHKDFIPNMITGATQADVALLVVDATRGEFETGFESGGQTREHALLVRSLGVSQLGVVVNKLDTVGWSQDRFQEITSKLSAFLRQAGFKESDVTYVPCSGLTGENMVVKPTAADLTSWYTGPCLIDVIDGFKTPERPITKPFRMSVNDIFKGMGAGFCVSGRVETGMVQPGDKVLVSPLGETAFIKVLMVDDMPIQTAFAGDCVSATISGMDQQNISVGNILCEPQRPIPITSRFQARIVIFQLRVPITKGYAVVLHHQSLVEQAVICKLVGQLHKSTGAIIKQKPRCLIGNSIALVELEVSRPICLELYSDIKELGRVMLRVGGVTIAAGLVTKVY
ncbi:HBS1-like protein isoform X2 [Thrips palmi]|uniref:HBS1-like protein isoform X2 n=1 Tax=Thrips palmi TaxID=161013 RepID=A0A6P9AH67_THRPL|nr:HBS1-like protein isoform X2 [Thrips palmi]